VAAVVDGAATLGLLVDGAEKLPFRGSHFGTCLRATRRGIEEEANDELVALGDEESAQLIEPNGSVDASRWLGKLVRGLASNGLRARGGMMVVQSGEMLLKLKGRVELRVR
jgi:hypothetical protein